MSDQTLPGLSALRGKRALVTGGASGIGFETARALATSGVEVLIADLNAEGGNAAVESIRRSTPGAQVSFASLDLGSLSHVEEFCSALLQKGQPLDLLFNNAGIQPLNSRRITREGFELTFGIGHLGHFALTGRLLPLLMAASAPRVVTTSSLVHSRGWIDRKDLQIEQRYDAQRAYNQTKLANLLFARELHSLAKRSGARLTSMAAHPGVARTSIGANRHRHGKLGWSDHLVSLTLAVVMPLLGQDAEKGALPLLYASTAAPNDDGGFYGPSGFGEMKGTPGRARIGKAALDQELARWLWEASVQLTGVDFHPLTQPTATRQSQAIA